MSALPPVEKPAPRIFISYSHDSAEHCERVLLLAKRLRSDGLDAQLDQFENSPPQGWPLWCARQILDSDYVLIVCTALYRDRFLGLEDFGKGRGVKWEAKVIQNILYYDEVNSGFIPVIFDPSDADHIPEPVKDASWYLVRPNGENSSGYTQLRQRLAGEKTFSPLPIPPPSEAYRQRDDASVPTEEVWNASRRVEEKLDNLRRLQKRQHRTVMASLALLALLLIAGIIWFKDSTENIVTDPQILRVKLEQKIKQSRVQKHRELVARKASPAEMDNLYRLEEDALRQVNESVRFIESTTKEAQATIAKKAVQILQEDGVDRALKYLQETISTEAQRHKERGRELAEASLLRAELHLNTLDYDRARSAIKQAVDFDYTWWVPHNRLGLFFYRQAQWTAAEAEYKEAQRFVDSEKNTATVLNNLALLLKATNRREEAEPFLRQALAIDEKIFGAEHPEVAANLSNLAQLLRAMNRLAEAEDLIKKALAIDEKHYGAEHPKVASRLSNLASLFKATNRLAEAEPLMKRALAIDEKHYRPEHPEVAASLNNLASLFKATNRLAEAEPLMKKALAIDEKHYGSEHPEVAGNLNNLASLFKATDRLAEAEPLMKRALEIDEKSYGPEHPKVAIRLNNLASLLKATNRLAEAEPLMRRALAINEKSYGPEHPTVAIRLHHLAELLQATNRLAEGEPLMRRAVVIFMKFTRSTGHNHARLKTTLADYRRMLEAMSLDEHEIARRISEIGKETGFDDENYRLLVAELST